MKRYLITEQNQKEDYAWTIFCHHEEMFGKEKGCRLLMKKIMTAINIYLQQNLKLVREWQVINEKNYDCDKYIPAAELEISKRLIE
jgi:hypothetical protein